MFFPEEIWSIIKALLLVDIDEYLWAKIGTFQRENNIGGLKLQCHFYYRILRTQPDELYDHAVNYLQIAQNRLTHLESMTTLNDYYFATNTVDAADVIWEDFKIDGRIAYDCSRVIQLVYRFFKNYGNIEKMVKILDMMSTIITSDIYYMNYLLDLHYSCLHKLRKTTKKGTINYIWEVADFKDVEKIQRLCCNTVDYFDKGKIVVAYGGGYESYINPRQKKEPFIHFPSAKMAGSFEVDILNGKGRFVELLDTAGFTLENDYSLK